MAISIRDPYTSPFTSLCKYDSLAVFYWSAVYAVKPPELLEVSKRRHNFGTKRFKEKSIFIFHARIALKSLILLFVRLIARGARVGKTHTQTDTQTDRHTDRTSTVTLAHARLGLIIIILQVWCSLKSYMYSGLGYSSYHIGEPSLISKLLLPCVHDTMIMQFYY